jgi:hypothetical protein
MLWDEGAAGLRAAIAGMRGGGRLPGDERQDDGMHSQGGC